LRGFCCGGEETETMPASGPSEKSRSTDCVDFSKWIFMIRILEYRGVKRKTEMILFSAFCGNLNPIYET